MKRQQLISRILTVMVILFTIILTGCGGGSRRERPVEEYDLYKVKVRTYLAVRERPSAKSPQVDALYNGAVINVYGVEDGWAKVKSRENGRYYYVKADYLRFVEEGPRAVAPVAENLSNAESEAESKSSRESVTSSSDKSPIKKSKESLSKNKSQHSASDPIEPQADTLIAKAAKGKGELIIQEKTPTFSQADMAMIAGSDVPDDWTFVVVAIDSVPYKKISSYTSELYDDLKKNLSKEKKKKFALFTYISHCRLVEYYTSNGVTGYIQNYYRDSTFNVQRETMLSEVTPGKAIRDYIAATALATREYEDMNWWKRWRYGTDNIVNEVIGGDMIGYILPSDSWLHKYVFSWLMKYPLKFCFWFMGHFSSMWWAMAWLMILMLVLTICIDYPMLKIQNKNERSYLILLLLALRFLLLGFLSLVVLCSMIYFLPNMSYIAIMSESGEYSRAAIDSVAKFYSAEPPHIGWGGYGLMVICIIGTVLLKKRLIPPMLCKTHVQQGLLNHLSNNVGEAMIWGVPIGDSSKMAELRSSENPFAEIYANSTGDALGGKIVFLIFACAVFNGTLVLFSILFFGGKCLMKLASILIVIFDYYRYKLLFWQ